MEENKLTTRLIITKMILENFKSYAGKQEIGPFHKRFSSIVGPNGSGKSNVIDALLFVFGKRAKQLRLNKVSELIHKSSNYPSLEYAKVEIYFQLISDNENSEDDYEVIPNSEFIVTRTAFKNNQSKYTIDGKNSTYTEVGTVLRSYGIDLDNNRFLILQGEVEQIAMMKPKSQPPNEDGLLEYLEDIIGSNKYVPQIEEASKNVEQLNELRVERVKRLQISQTDRESLERPRTEAQAYLEREANIRLKNNILYQVYLQDCDQNIEALSTKLKGYHERLKEEKIKLTETEKTLKTLDKNYQQILLEYERLTSEMQKTVDDFTAYERRDTKMIEDMKYTKSEIQKLEVSIKKETTKEKEAISSIEKYEQEIHTLRNDLVTIQARKEAAEKHLDEVMGSLQQSTAHLRVELEAAQAELTESDRSVAELQTEKENIETAINLVESRSTSTIKQIEASEAKLNSLTNEENEIISGRSTIQTRKNNLGQRLNTLTENLINLRQKQNDLQSRVRQAVSVSEESKAAMQSQQSSSGVVRSEIASILKQTKPGGCLSRVGVRGRLGDLGTINSEYDTAISTACGCLDYIVVDSGDAANACIAYLRETNSGRASFIVLDQLGHSTSKMDATLQIPPGTQRLFDLIRPKDPIYRPAFYMALRDTLVTDDWDLATRVAYEGDRVKWRIVTTSGNLIDTSGSMTGGGKPPSNGGMKAQSAKDEVKITPEQIEALDAEVERLQNELSNCRSDINKTEKEISEVEKEFKKIQLEVDKTELQLSRIVSEREDINSRLTTLRNSCSLTSEEISEKNSLEKKLVKVCRKIDEISPNRTQIQTNVKEIQQRILDVGGPGLKRAQSKVDSATSEYSACQSSISAKEVALATAVKQKTKASNSKNKAENDLENALDKKSKLEAEHEQMESEAAVVLKAQELAKQAALAKEKELNEFTEEYKRLQDTIRVIKEVEIDLRSNFDNCNKLLTENQSKRASVFKELSKVRKQHDEDMKEFGLFFESHSSEKVEGCGEETKGEVNDDNDNDNDDDDDDDDEIKDNSKTIKPLSPVLQIMKDYNLTELIEILGISSNEALPVTVETNTTTNAPTKRGRGRKQAEVVNEEQEETKIHDDPKRNAIESLKGEINLMEADRDRLKTAVNMNSLLEYKKKDEEFRARLVELEDVTNQRNNSRKEYEDLRRKRLEEFMTGFGIITLKLKEMYQMITLGGDAELELVDSLDPFSEGIVFSVRPPKKSWKNISNLSGGEKTLSSLALVFALHHFKPTPLYVMDEIDAALDFKNVSIVANYIKQRTKNAQFVIISLRNNMFELANRLVGIYKTNDTTKSVTINPHCFESVIQSSTSSTIATTTTTKATTRVSSNESNNDSISNLKDENNHEEESPSPSPSPLTKKGRPSQKNYSLGEENESNLITQKVLNYNRNERKNVLSDSTNKL